MQVVALGNIDHDGHSYTLGDTFNVTEEQARSLVADGVVKLRDGEALEEVPQPAESPAEEAPASEPVPEEVPAEAPAEAVEAPAQPEGDAGAESPAEESKSEEAPQDGAEAPATGQAPDQPVPVKVK